VLPEKKLDEGAAPQDAEVGELQGQQLRSLLALSPRIVSRTAPRCAHSHTTGAHFSLLALANLAGIYVRNLAWSTTDEDLLAHFSQCPGAQSAEVQVATSGRSKGWALVTFETMEQAEEAAVVMNNSILHERNLTVRLARK
jgi:hypothetical protein